MVFFFLSLTYKILHNTDFAMCCNLYYDFSGKKKIHLLLNQTFYLKKIAKYITM